MRVLSVLVSLAVLLTLAVGQLLSNQNVFSPIGQSQILQGPQLLGNPQAGFSIHRSAGVILNDDPNQGKISEINTRTSTNKEIEVDDSLDWLLIQKVLEKSQSNVILSPFSIKLLLTILSEASADGSNTQKELGIIQPGVRTPQTVRDRYAQIFSSLKAPNNGNYQFQIGTRVFVSEYVEPTQRFTAIVEQYYDAAINKLNFADSGHTAQLINQWCSNITNGNIKDLVQPGDIQNSVMIMLNAIYFNGIWKHPFAAEQTTQTQFFINPSTPVVTSFMTQSAKFFFVESQPLGSKILRLPYAGNRFSMLVILPNSKDGLDGLIRNIQGPKIRDALSLMTEMEVHLTMPKFKFESLSNMNSVLQEIGIREIFTPSASLPLLARGNGINNQLFVSNIIQKAGIAVDERGSTVYAASEVSLINKFGEVDFIVDRPFLFLIEDETTGTFVFAGKVSSPGEGNFNPTSTF